MFKSFTKFIFQMIYWLTIKEFSEKLELVVSYTKVQFVVELRAFSVQVREVTCISCSCSLVPKSPARTSRGLKSVTNNR
jgi:hypothetical protein